MIVPRMIPSQTVKSPRKMKLWGVFLWRLEKQERAMIQAKARPQLVYISHLFCSPWRSPWRCPRRRTRRWLRPWWPAGPSGCCRLSWWSNLKPIKAVSKTTSKAIEVAVVVMNWVGSLLSTLKKNISFEQSSTSPSLCCRLEWSWAADWNAVITPLITGSCFPVLGLKQTKLPWPHLDCLLMVMQRFWKT